MKPIVAWMLLLVLVVALVPAWAEEEAAITPYAYWATETLPRIYIETENGMALDDPSLVIPDEHKGMAGEIAVYDYVNATITVTDCEGYELDAVAGQVKIRGNYTSNYPKKPIRIKFSEKQAMAGLNEGNAMKSWVLLAEYKDPALLRNSVALYVANSLYSTTGNYASDFRNVEVYLNGDAWYIRSLQAFSTKEWMKVAIDGITYQIAVTDAQGLTSGSTSWSGDLVVSSDLTIDQLDPGTKSRRVRLTGDATLEIKSGATLTVPWGIYVPKGRTLTITGGGILKAGSIHKEDGNASYPDEY